ncbi:Hypothetical predicted protein [Pelobates cultripes]|uniref:Helix-turn-helix domain-containing protein n=1 Tax=Pelobates cultripes TaxID=61616 RepID=A0AAD1RCL8_PELCU|nr:Hypothetical predicted protein [Pelobates cultripes]
MIGRALEPKAKWLDYRYKEMVENVPICIKDTPSLLKLLREIASLEPTTLLLTCNVKSIYSIIPHQAGRKAMGRILTNSLYYSGPPVELTLELLQLLLSNNYFNFEKTWYKQIAGTSMGAAMFIFEQEHILTPLQDNILFYCRYINDILMIWKGTLESRQQMLEKINNLDTLAGLTMSVDIQTVDFLDVCLYKEDTKIAYTSFSKPTDRNTLLHANSYHPQHLKDSLPYSQILRVIRNYSNLANA